MRAHEATNAHVPPTLRIPMRGYEVVDYAAGKRAALCYESPCGVMSALVVAYELYDDVLRIPMRGYESPVASFADLTFPVTNPHAGL